VGPPLVGVVQTSWRFGGEVLPLLPLYTISPLDRAADFSSAEVAQIPLGHVCHGVFFRNCFINRHSLNIVIRSL
jgi:hypothetical protein